MSAPGTRGRGVAGRGIARRGTTLVEALAVVVVLSLAVPAATALMIDAARARRDASAAVRAAWLVSGMLEHVLADVSVPGAPGFGALADADEYLNDSATGLYTRTLSLRDAAAEFGVGCTVTIGPPTDHAGAATGNPAIDVYRLVTVSATLPGSTPGSATISASARVTGP